MDGFTYNDIFETKGLEYLIIIAFLIFLIFFWIILNKQVLIADQLHKVIGVLKASILRIPHGLFYSKNHTWAYLEKSGTVKIGLDDFLLQVLGNVKINILKFPGEKIMKGDFLAEIDQNGKRLRITAPISGEIISSNSLIVDTPNIIHEDPYGKGWIYAIKPSDWKADIPSFYLAEEASKWIIEELERFKDFLAQSVSKYSHEPLMVIYQEGGELRQHLLSEFDSKIWHDFQEEFMSS